MERVSVRNRESECEICEKWRVNVRDGEIECEKWRVSVRDVRNGE